MKCPRCLGFMVIDACLNLEGEGNNRNNNVWISKVPRPKGGAFQNP